MIDSHCHLADKKFTADLDQVIQRATEVGVGNIVCIADTLEEADRCLEIAQKYDHIFCTIGLHPHTACEWKTENGKRKMQEFSEDPNVVAIGEIGLDYHYMNSPKEDQIVAFRDQIHIAKELNLPIVTHNRESIEDFKRIVFELEPASMVLHCCTEQWADVSDLVECGYLLGFTGIATYPKSDAIRNTIAQCPLEQMMIETDAPYLAPQEKRGQRNEPAFVAEVCKCIAEVKGISVEEVDAVTTGNAQEFYGIHLK